MIQRVLLVRGCAASLVLAVSVASLASASGCGSDGGTPATAPDASALADASPPIDAADAADAADGHIRCDSGPSTACAPVQPTAGQVTCAGKDLQEVPLPDALVDASFPIGCAVTSHPDGFEDDPATWGNGCSGLTCYCMTEPAPSDGGTHDAGLVGEWECPL